MKYVLLCCCVIKLFFVFLCVFYFLSVITMRIICFHVGVADFKFAFFIPYKIFFHVAANVAAHVDKREVPPKVESVIISLR